MTRAVPRIAAMHGRGIDVRAGVSNHALRPIADRRSLQMTTKTGESERKPQPKPDREKVEAEVRYETYLHLEKLLDAQYPRSEPPHHDEMLFIIQHQVAELWFKLVLHELDAAIECLKRDQLARSIKILARLKQVQHQLTAQWSVLATLTPSAYAAFRDVLGTASGFQSLQYRVLEFKLGNKDRNMLPMFRHNLEYYRTLKTALESPSIYDEFLRYLYRVGHRVPLERVDRDWTERYEHHPGVVDVLEVIYKHPDEYWAAYEVCENLVDIETNFQSWRFHHMKTVERIIGFKSGTGGTAGVKFLKKALDIVFFPELTEVRTKIGD
jgi:tryptophan 2,3-dioxygenase